MHIAALTLLVLGVATLCNNTGAESLSASNLDREALLGPLATHQAQEDDPYRPLSALHHDSDAI